MPAGDGSEQEKKGYTVANDAGTCSGIPHHFSMNVQKDFKRNGRQQIGI